MQDQLYNILQRLIVKSNISINNDELKLQFSSHPSYPSMHALTGVLDHFNIPNLAIRVAVNENILSQLPKYFIAQILMDGREELILVERKNERLKITTDGKKIITLGQQQFLEQWNGIVVAIEKDESIDEVKQTSYKKLAKWGLICLGGIGIVLIIASFNSLFPPVHFSLSIIGLILSVFIIKHEIGLQSSTANSFCNLSDKTSCDAVLNSNGANILGLFKLSDMSLVVFSSFSFLWIFSFINATASTTIISIVSLMAIPFVIYSVLYQYKVVKKWCPLCLAIGSVLLLQGAAVALNDFNSLIAFNLSSIVLLGISVIVTTSVWIILKPSFHKKKILEELEVDHFKFKRNFSVFNALYREGDALTSHFPIKNEIVLGNFNAPVELVLVTSPFCYYCKQAHIDIAKILSTASSDVKVIIRFNVNIENKDSDFYKIATQLLHIFNTSGAHELLNALDIIYSKDADLKQWIEKHHQLITNSYDSVLLEQSNWCENNGINFTPALYLNEKLYPKEYDRTDLIYFIENLTEQSNNATLGTHHQVA